ncbi:MAG: DUF4019 domain-containing protein [Verrucomicrobiota bacterium]|nr:DUF4019 domain-containing protein [Verrucomicrobiota bacterium]
MTIKLLESQTAAFLCAVLLAGFASGCGPKAAPGAEKAATSAAQIWLAEIDASHYAQSWQKASVVFQSAVSEEKWQSALEAVRKPLGDLESRKLRSAQYATQLPGAPDGQYVVMQFEASFANKKSAVETVTFRLEKDGLWKAAGYFIK